MTRPVAIDLFSGAGGLSLGFEQAGFDIASAIDIDPIHAAVHKFNFPQCTVFPKSVRDLSGEMIRELSELEDRKVDVVVGGAPCQGFSLIGHRALDDPRNSLVREFVRLVAELAPSYFVFENVKGLTVGRHVCFLEEVIAAFEDLGYRVRLPWKVLNASRYGVPQDRERLFLLGAKDGFPLPTYPSQTTCPADQKEMELYLPAGPTCKDALGDLPEVEKFKCLIEGDSAEIKNWRSPSRYARELRCMTPSSWHYGYRRKWNPRILTSSIRTYHTDISRLRFSETEPATVEPISRFYRLSASGIANTLRAGTDSARGAFTSPRPIHYKYLRCVTVREMARLHGFPDWFRFHETKWHGARQIGNAVPPPLARAIATAVMAALGIDPSRPKIVVKLGDPMLLRMGMSDAAAYWGIRVPIGRRDRKSGAKKRKQEEIEAQRFLDM